MRPARDTALNPAASLVLCLLGGALFSWARTPLPWMIGPLTVMAVCNFGGARLRGPPGGRQIGQIVIGTALGLYFSQEVARQVLSFWPFLLLAAVLSIVIACVCAVFVMRLTGTDGATAFFASVPGGAAEMAVLAERYGARVDRVAIAQSMRILVVVVVVPFALTYSGVHGTDAYATVAIAQDWRGLAILIGLAACGGALFAACRLPNAFMLGALVCVIGLTLNNVHLSSIPAPVSNAAQLLIGCSLGGRFERSFLGRMPRFVATTLASVLIAILLAALSGAGLAWASGLPIPSAVLATAPGGIAEMCITAKVLQLGVPLVTAAHVTRVVLLVTGTGPLFRWARNVVRFRRGL